MKISFVIPVFRNEGLIIPTYSKIVNLLLKIAVDYEFIFVDDDSDDKSIDDLLDLHSKDENVKIISFSTHFRQMRVLIFRREVFCGNF